MLLLYGCFQLSRYQRNYHSTIMSSNHVNSHEGSLGAWKAFSKNERMLSSPSTPSPSKALPFTWLLWWPSEVPVEHPFIPKQHVVLVQEQHNHILLHWAFNQYLKKRPITIVQHDSKVKLLSKRRIDGNREEIYWDGRGFSRLSRIAWNERRERVEIRMMKVW